MSDETKVVTRRTIAKGAAWTVPVVALGAGAAQAATSNPPCPSPDCAQPVVSVATFTTGVGNPKRGENVADLSMVAGAFYANFLSCSTGGLLQASIFTVTEATLTMSDGKSYTTTSGLPIGASASSQAVLASVGMSFKSVTFPDGGILGGLLNPPVRPQTMCFTYVLVLNILGGGAPTGGKIECPGQVCFRFNLVNGTVYSVNRPIIPNTVTYITTGLGA